jgi:N-acetyl-1-D-myo-inositol-2-amino-2-deoxy-alpha-D-glucopyranoside deacetylase
MVSSEEGAMSERAASRDADRMGVGAAVVSCVFAFVIGGIAGLLTTFAHAQLAPWGLVAGFAVAAALVAGFRLVFASRLVGGAAAIGFLVAGALLAVPGAGAPVLRFDGPIGWLWAIVPVLIALAALVPPWPGRVSDRA